MANSLTIQNSGFSVLGAESIVDPTAGTYTVPVNAKLTMAYTAGSGAGAINVATQGQIVLTASGAATINLNTGAITGGTTTINGLTVTSLTKPDGAVFTTTAVKDFQFQLATSGSASATLYSGPSNGWSSMLGSGTFPLRGGTNGGGLKSLCSDSIGWAVSSGLANLVITNADSASAATIQFYLGGI